MPSHFPKILARTFVGFAVCAVMNFAAAHAAASTQPIQLGVYLPGGGGSAGALDNYASEVGRSPNIFLVFRNMEGPLLYPSEITNLEARGEIPMVTLELYTNTGVASLADIAAGKYDSFFRREADAVRGLNTTILLRFAHEMNLTSSDWGPGKDGNVGSGYVEAWRHVVSIFRQEGATNVKWVWAPNVDNGGHPFNQFYPGDEWVDYVGLDGYNWGTSSGGTWESFSKIFASSYAAITQLSSKPVIISETGSSEIGGSKAAWIEEAFLETIPRTMPRVSAVVWFDDNKERDWSIDSSASSLAAYQKVVSSTFYGGTQTPAVEQEPEPPVVKELEIVPNPSPPVKTSSLSSNKSKGKQSGGRRKGHGVRLRGRISYRLSRRATVRIVMWRRHSRARPLVFTVEQAAGHRRMALRTLVGRHRFGRGSYRMSVVAFSDAGGNRSRPRHYGFRIPRPVRRPAHRRHRRTI